MLAVTQPVRPPYVSLIVLGKNKRTQGLIGDVILRRIADAAAA